MNGLLVFRNGAGAIVGGASSAYQDVSLDSITPGDSTRSMHITISGGLPKNVDLAKTEAYVGRS